MRSITDSVNENDDDLVSRFDASTCTGDNVYDMICNVEEMITEYYNVCVNTNKTIW